MITKVSPDATLPRWFKRVLTEADLTAAALTQTVDLLVLPANVVVHNLLLDSTVAWTGGGVTAANVQIGYSGATARYLGITDIFTAPTRVLSTLFDRNLDENVTRTVQALFTTVTANVVALTAGTATVWLQYSVMP